MTQPILDVKHLKTYFFTDDGEIPAVDDVSFSISEGEVLGIVGESGCGKSVTALSTMKLVPYPPGKIVGGEILFKGKDLVPYSEAQMRKIRGNEIGMIFQEPMTSLNPVFTIGRQVSEAIRIHKKVSKEKAREMAIDMIKQVGIARAEEIVDEYPHRLSGGMRQRVMIAMAMSCEPDLLIADEPTTALDVTIQAQILDLMKKLNKEHGTAIMMITHDLGVVAETCDRVIVMYSGKIVEEGDVRSILKNPQHPYTKGLLESLPKVHQQEERLYSIPGNVPKPGSIKGGCSFAPRCKYAFDDCFKESPELVEITPGHTARCLLYTVEGGAEVG